MPRGPQKPETDRLDSKLFFLSHVPQPPCVHFWIISRLSLHSRTSLDHFRSVLANGTCACALAVHTPLPSTTCNKLPPRPSAPPVSKFQITVLVHAPLSLITSHPQSASDSSASVPLASTQAKMHPVSYGPLRESPRVSTPRSYVTQPSLAKPGFRLVRSGPVRSGPPPSSRHESRGRSVAPLIEAATHNALQTQAGTRQRASSLSKFTAHATTCLPDCQRVEPRSNCHLLTATCPCRQPSIRTSGLQPGTTSSKTARFVPQAGASCTGRVCEATRNVPAQRARSRTL